MLTTKLKKERGFNGNLSSIPLLDIFQLLFSGRKSGVLEIVDGESKTKIYLKSGLIIAAESTMDKDLLGNLFIKRCRLPKRELNQATNLHRKTGKPLGEILIEMEILSEVEINSALKIKVEEIIYDLFGWKSGNFQFHEGDVSPRPELENPLNPMNVIMEATRRLDEWAQIQEDLPPENSILFPIIPEDFAENDIRITKDDFAIITSINGKKSLRQILTDSPYDRFTTAKSIHRFITMGLLGYSKSEIEDNDNIEENPQSVLEEILRFHKDIYELVSGFFSEYMGEAGAGILTKVFKKRRYKNSILDKATSSNGNTIDFSKVSEGDKSLTDLAYLYKVSISFYALSKAYLEAVREFLGGDIFNEATSRLKKRNLRRFESRRQQLMAFGVEEEIFKLLNIK